MNSDFHYYATYSAALLAGFSHEESMEICFAANFVDFCSKTFIVRVGGPIEAATTNLAMELADEDSGVTGLQDITRIWASFHFLPKDLYVDLPHRTKTYMRKYRLICGPNSKLLEETVSRAKGAGTQAAGLAMHVLADTWAHMYFVGTPSQTLNSALHFTELRETERGEERIPIRFRSSATKPDDLENNIFNHSMPQPSENGIMNLGHGRAGHLPDYSFMRYEFMPAWGEYEVIVKDNPSDYYKAFCQMVYALRWLRTEEKDPFLAEIYDTKATGPHKDEIMEIIKKRQTDAADDWKAFGEKLSGQEILEFDISKYEDEYRNAERDARKDTYLGKFFLASMGQKSLVTNRIYNSGNKLAGFSIEYGKSGFKGNRAFYRAAEISRKAGGNQ